MSYSYRLNLLRPRVVSFKAEWSQKWRASGIEIRDDGKRAVVTGEDGDHIIVMGNNKITEGIVSVTVQVTIPQPNRYVFGVLPALPQNYNKAFTYHSGPPGFGLRDYAEPTSQHGIYYLDEFKAASSSGFCTGDLVCPSHVDFYRCCVSGYTTCEC